LSAAVKTASRFKLKGSAMAHSNLSPFSVDVPAVAYADFIQADENLTAAQGSTQAFLDTFAGLGGSLAYMSRPNAASSPEHRHIYAVWVRLCLAKAARMLDVDVSEFESVYSGAVKAGDTVDRVVIGGESKTVTDWKGLRFQRGPRRKASYATARG
jgi:hypothetical protein